MSVEVDTATTDEATTDTTPRKRTPRTTRPQRLLSNCERCGMSVRGTGAGFACVDLREATAAAHGRLRTDDGDPVKAAWRVLHTKCAPDAVKPLNPYFRIWIERMTSVDDLLDTVAELSRLPWFAGSDWGRLVRRVLADTHAATEGVEERAAKRAEARRRLLGTLPPDDPKHGTANGYGNYGCRCDPCTAANAEQKRLSRNKRKQALRAAETNQPNGSQPVSRMMAVDSPMGHTQTGMDA